MNKTATILASAAAIAFISVGFETVRHNNTFTTNGVTYAQRGGLGVADYVVTNIDASAVGKVQSVNGKTGAVVLSASDVGAVDANGVLETLGQFATTGKVSNANYAYSADSAFTAYWLNASGNYLQWGGRWGYSDSDTGSNFYPFAYLSDVDAATNALAQSGTVYEARRLYYANDAWGGLSLYGQVVTRHLGDMVITEPRWLASSSEVVSYLSDIDAALGQFAATGTVATANYATSADSANRLLTGGGVELRFDDGTERWITPALFTPYDEAVAYLSDFSTNNIALSNAVAAITRPALNTLEDTVSDHETAIQTVTEDNEQTRAIVTTWENFLDGSNVVFSITNYISGTYSLDAAKLTIKELRDGAYREVYNSRDEILLHLQNFRENDLKNATNQVAAAIENKADRDWGKYTSSGGEAPSNTVYMTAPNTVFAGGLEYERVAVGEGTVCVLTTRGAPVWTQGDEGTFKFQDDGGTNYFGFAKTDSYVIGANADGIAVQSGIVTMNYNITMSGRPCIWYKADLTSDAAWEQLNLPDGSPVSGASHVVTWEQNPPANSQVCYINVGNQPQGYFRATVEVAGEAKFMTNMPADLSGGIICPNTATGVNGVIKPTFNGSTVTWTWSAM